GPQLPRPRPAAADPRMGRHAGREPRCPACRLVAGSVSGRRHYPDGHRLQHHRGLPAEALRGTHRMRSAAEASSTGDYPPLVDIRNLSIGFGGPPLVQGVDLIVRAGECVALVGESGSGKSLTARSLLNLAGAGAMVEAH